MFAPICRDGRAVLQRVDVRRLPDDGLQPAMVWQAVPMNEAVLRRFPDIDLDRAADRRGLHASSASRRRSR
jgi:hypothetical protein